MGRERELREELEKALRHVEEERYREAERCIVRARRLVEHVQKPKVPDELLPRIVLVNRKEGI